MERIGFGQRIREIRKRKGVTQVELAEKLGVTQRGISYYENETQNPSMEIIERIANALGVAKKMLIEYDDNTILIEPKAIRALQKRMEIIPKLPPEGQRYLVETIDMLAGKHGIQ